MEVAYSLYAACIGSVCMQILSAHWENFFEIFEIYFGIYGFILFLLTVCQKIKMNSLVCHC